LGRLAQDLTQAEFNAIKKLIHALLQALVLVHQGIAHHDAGHAGVALAELQHQRHDATRLGGSIAIALGHLVDQGKDALFDEVDQALKHLGF
jgi:hypothetical protein